MYDPTLNASTDSEEAPPNNTPTDTGDTGNQSSTVDDNIVGSRKSRGKAMQQELHKLRKLVLKQANEIELLKAENTEASNAVQDVLEEVTDLSTQLEFERSKSDVLISQAKILTRERDDIAECLDQKMESKADASCLTCAEYDAKYHSLSVRFKMISQEKERLASDLSRIRSERDELLQTTFRANERTKRLEERLENVTFKKVKPPLPPKSYVSHSDRSSPKVEMIKTADLAIVMDDGDDTTVDTSHSSYLEKQSQSSRNSLVQSPPPDLGTLPIRGRSTRRPLRRGQEEEECFIPETWDQEEVPPPPRTPLGFRLGRKRYPNEASPTISTNDSPKARASPRSSLRSHVTSTMAVS